jgi:peptidoglycan/LPS O-acetylase OafA/YrhL
MTKVRGVPSMTGIRGIAALWVMLYHAQQSAGKIFGLPFLEQVRVFGKGWHGVDLFFMLSGFILIYAHERDFHVIRKDNLIRFAKLRFTRVYPLNAVVLLLIAVFVEFQPAFVQWTRTTFDPFWFSRGAFVRTLFLATRWFLPGSGEWNQPVWSLSLEVLGYAMFPWLAFCALRVARKWQLIGIASLSLAGSLVVSASQGSLFNPNGQLAVVRMIACFVTGIAIFRLWTLTAESGMKWAGRITAISAAGIFIASLSYRGNAVFNFFFASLLYGLAFQRGFVNALLSSRIAVFLGEISFPLYLVHVVPLLWLRYFLLSNAAMYSHIQKSAALICWAAGCILMATFLHYFAEKPFHALGRRWAGARVRQ